MGGGMDDHATGCADYFISRLIHAARVSLTLQKKANSKAKLLGKHLILNTRIRHIASLALAHKLIPSDAAAAVIAGGDLS